MKDAPDSLRQLQKWVQAALMNSPEVGAKPGEEGIVRTILPSKQQTSAQRLAVYQQAYAARLVECLRAQFPAVAHVLGEDAFGVLAQAYLQQHPSRSYTLERLADRFVGFLRTSRPEKKGSQSQLDWSDFLIDLASLEHAIDAVFDGPGDEGDPPLMPERLQPLVAESGDGLRLRFSPSVRLLAFDFPVSEYYTAYRRGEEPKLPPLRKTWLALHRRAYVVERHALTEPAFRLLAALQQGCTLGEAVAASAASSAGSPDEAEIARWFEAWSRCGFFIAAYLNAEPSISGSQRHG